MIRASLMREINPIEDDECDLGMQDVSTTL